MKINTVVTLFAVTAPFYAMTAMAGAISSSGAPPPPPPKATCFAPGASEGQGVKVTLMPETGAKSILQVFKDSKLLVSASVWRFYGVTTLQGQDLIVRYLGKHAILDFESESSYLNDGDTPKAQLILTGELSTSQALECSIRW